MADAAQRTTWITCSRREAEEWALVLTAAGIPHELTESPGGWELRVAWRDRDSVARELEAFRAETEVSGAASAEWREYGRSYAGVTLAVLLVAFFLLTGPRDSAVYWFRAGSATATDILSGELWRTVTALTLHADAAHVLGNAASCAVFVTALSRVIGPGMASWILLLAGGLGNATTALLHGGQHSSVGASTALFGSLGGLAGFQFVAWRRRLRRQGRAWVPIAAGLALLAMLGTGRNADVGAHFFGFAIGIPLGALATLTGHRLPGRGIQWIMTLAAALTVGAAWAMALV